MNLRKSIGLLSISLAFLGSASAIASDGDAVLIRCDGDCSKAVRAIKKAGGTIKYQYKNIDAIAASLPDGGRHEISGARGIASVSKDHVVKRPQAAREEKLAGVNLASGVSALPAIAGRGSDQPEDYLSGIASVGALDMFAGGHTGDGVVNVVIDTGTYVDHFMFDRDGCDAPGAFDKTVIGGETYIGAAGGGEPSATSDSNEDHGTWVGTTIASNVAITFSAPWVAPIIDTYLPGSVLPGGVVPIVGVAPCSHIYALKVFSAFGGGAPTSDIVAAMDRAITMKKNFDNGDPVVPVSGDGSVEDPFVYDSLNVGTINMSLGGPTTFAGNDVDDLLTEVALANDIVIVNSAGNEGPAAMTGGSAGTGRGALTSGAASIAGHERIVAELFFATFPGGGELYRPTDHTQVAIFSSRGPSADGRISTNAVAPGDYILVGGADGGCCSWVSGTSFSAPFTTGAAALLRDVMPGASALQVRNALIETADPSIIGPEAGPIDQGNGFINIPAAYAALAGGLVSDDTDLGHESASVKSNINRLGFKAQKPGLGGYHTSFEDLVPGEVGHVFVEVGPNSQGLFISLDNIDPELPPAEQNAFFGDDLVVMVQNSTTSDEDPLVIGFFPEDDSFFVAPDPGIVRLGVMGDWTNAGTISVDVSVWEIPGPGMTPYASGSVPENDFDVVFVEVPAGLDSVTFETSWNNDWGSYPTDDIDMIVFDPVFADNYDGATLASPESVTYAFPVPGTYAVIVDGFTVWGEHGGPQAKYKVYAYDQDGNSL